MKIELFRLAVPLVVASMLAVTSAQAGDHSDERRGMHMDNRFSHDRYYHDRGFSVAVVPRGAYEIRHGGGTYWYHGGEWYQRRGGLSIVVGAPIGAFVPALPLYYSTVWWRGVPYYYADDTYYAWQPSQKEYQVVDAPAGIDAGGTTTPPPTDRVFIYPKNGQSEQQQDQDRYECHRFAVGQSGFDPTVAGGGVPADTSAAKRSDYLRAEAACLEGRGYTVK